MKRLVQTEDDREFENLAQDSSGKTEFQTVISATENPEEIFSDAEAQKDVTNALTEAIANLKDEDRLIMKLYYFDDLKLKDIAETFGFHEATASRKLVRVQSEIRKLVEKSLAEKHGWEESEVKKHLSATASKLGFNMEQLFNVLLFLILVQESIWSSVL